ncbi:type 1 glutamine amidotransferase family protein [Longimicrobium terrae]|uniref:Putative intracellular protease/amidase n=1 Tax=Longimicrobium terrae TaxID=1639882 RepID=A0A841H7L5_9BACT|nr:type 1 glutamine amidotransferase family protein [Longimicrobium terrae]MBB4639464.1 putative intracellular protease/amidase [Longimicrobium terrae]MBB6073836.1 putative intracellular protease/amidase [Longimicrobium terrae]NNC32513.1 glutamine amidotransferase [Longimicrobium terrae]
MEAQTVHLFVLDTMSDWEPGYAIAGINQPVYQRNPGRYVVRTVGPTRDPVRTMGGITILPDVALDELRAEDSAMLILPGAASWDEGAHADAVDKAREFLAAGVPVAAICGATGALARAGMLNDRPHTSNAVEYLNWQDGYTGAEHYAGSPALRDGDLITASGTAPVDFARAIFERLELYAPEALDAWYALYKHNDPAGFYKLVELEQAASA